MKIIYVILPLNKLINFKLNGGCYDIAKRINERKSLTLSSKDDFLSLYQSHCQEFGIKFQDVPHNHSVLSPDNTSLFCTSGMHHLKNQYSDTNYFDTFANLQKVLRLNDLSELVFKSFTESENLNSNSNSITVENQRHWLIFNMVGLFSFRQLTVKQTIHFILSFLLKLDIIPDYVTIHNDKYHEWKEYYFEFCKNNNIPNVNIVIDNENCTWQHSPSEPIIYCTELFYKSIEIGNIVNPLGDCIDVGLGMERLLMLSPLTSETSQYHYKNRQSRDIFVENQKILLNTIEHLMSELNDIQNNQNEQGTQYLHKGVGFQLKKLILIFIENQIFLNNNDNEINDKLKLFKNNDLFNRVFNNKKDKLHYLIQQSNLNSKIWKNNDMDFWKNVHGISNNMYLIVKNKNDLNNQHHYFNLIQFFELNLD